MRRGRVERGAPGEPAPSPLCTFRACDMPCFLCTDTPGIHAVRLSQA